MQQIRLQANLYFTLGAKFLEPLPMRRSPPKPASPMRPRGATEEELQTRDRSDAVNWRPNATSRGDLKNRSRLASGYWY